MKSYLLVACVALATCASAFAADIKPDDDLIKTVPKKKIKREKEQLTLTLKNGKKKTYKDNLAEGTEKYIRHLLADYIAKHDVAVIQQLFYEGGQFLVVSLKDGSEIVTSTKPTWSPKQTNFISVNDDESEYTENKTVIGSCKDKKCKKVFTEETHAGNEKWIDDKTVEYENRKFDPGTGTSENSDYVCKIEKKVICNTKK